MAAKKPPADAKPDPTQKKTGKGKPAQDKADKPDQAEAPGTPLERRKKLPGRPSKLTARVIEEVAFLLGTGAFAVTVAKAIGVSEKTWYNWLDKGQEALTKPAKKRTPNEVLAVRLVQAVEQAEALGEITMLTNCRIGAPGWQGSAWILQRRWRDRWGDSANDGGSGALADLVIAMQNARTARAEPGL